MENFLYLIVSGLIGYLFGAIPVGYLLVKAKTNTDIREVGSGRTGGTNAFRAGGVLVGVLTAVLDVFKAACAIWIVQALFGDRLTVEWLPWAEATTGVMSVVGHNWSIFLGWKGGAGTGPNVGWAGALWLPIIPLAILVVLGVLLGLGIASIASLAMSATVIVAFVGLYLAGVAPFDTTLAYITGSIVAAAIISWSLRPNIKRLLAGQERIVGPRARRLGKKESEEAGG